ncbi:MAG: hypothetical protein V3W34_15365 [Phycisphaerae bacterium]
MPFDRTIVGKGSRAAGPVILSFVWAGTFVVSSDTVLGTVILIDDNRFVSAEATAVGMTDSDTESAPVFGASWMDSVSANISEDNLGWASASASQDSMITQNGSLSLNVLGSVSGLGGSRFDVPGRGIGTSFLGLAFTIDQPSDWSLSGTLGRGPGRGVLDQTVILSGDSGEVFSVTGPPNDDPNQPTSLSIDASGLLMPGETYFFIISSEALSGTPLLVTTSSVTGSYSLNFSVIPVPCAAFPDADHDGDVWGENVGWINLNDATHFVAGVFDVSCDDGNPCTEDICVDGKCVHTPVNCTDTFCADYECHPAGAEGNCDSVTPQHEGEACDDADPCNTGEACQAGACLGGSAVTCTDPNPDDCASPVCDAAGSEGNCNGSANEPDDTPCDDGLFCNENETCQAGSCTGGNAVDCSGLSDQCNNGVCDDDLDQCVPDPAPHEGDPCDDGLYCNENETCQAGSCTGGNDPCPGHCDEVNDECLGACCLGSGCLQNQTQEFCENALGGLHAGGGTDCDDMPPPCDFGACCTSEECVDVFQVACKANGGAFQGLGVACDPNPCPGACCQPDGTCDTTTEDVCTGSWLGVGTACDPNPCHGACCVNGECVLDQTEEDCLSVPGQWAGPETDCADPLLCVNGACCIGAACVDNPESNCLSVDGYWLGLFTACETGTCVSCDTGDADADEDVDLRDFAAFQTCFGARYAFPCDCLDIDSDGNVDLDDYAEFVARVTGPYP